MKQDKKTQIKKFLYKTCYKITIKTTDNNVLNEKVNVLSHILILTSYYGVRSRLSSGTLRTESAMQWWAPLYSEVQRWAPLYSEIQWWARATLISEMQSWAPLYSEMQR